MKADLYLSDGTKKGTIELNPKIFEVKENKDLIHRAVVMRLANARNPIAHTKTRSDVIMTTAKAFKQKGTGRARRGAKSINLLRGGGVTHGPRNTRNFKKNMPKKERRAALFSSLSAKAKNQEIFGLKNFDAKVPKTKDFVSLLKKLPEAKKYLFVLTEKNFNFEKSVSNIPNIKTILVNYINPYDVLNTEKICFVGESVDKLEDVFLEKK